MESGATGEVTSSDLRLVRWQIDVALLAVFFGILLGLAQALDRWGIDLYPHIPFLHNYYQGLTAHGVFNVFIFTFGFTNGFLVLVTARSLRRAPNRALLWSAFGLLLLGGGLAAEEIFANRASVLYTMYPPLKASALYYVGAVLLVVSTWAAGLNVFVMYRAWRREHRQERVPLQAFTVIATYAMWMIASVGVATEVLGFLLPWSLGIEPKIDPELARTLFWFSGHPIVYFWLLPAYVSWYTIIPKQVGGRLFSDPLARLVFILFLVFSIPTGFHHQYTDPGIAHVFKRIHLFMTYAIFFPSMITAFSVMASLENGGRARGGKGLLGWIPKLPWGDPSVAAQLLAMAAFTLGGVSGLVNASYNVNLVIHNTSWVPGHFHLTVGTAVALTFFGIAYWLVPNLTGRKLWGRRLALAQAWLWFVGMLIFARGQIDGGLEGLPRRLHMSLTTYKIDAWDWSNVLTGLGGVILFASGMLFFAVIVGTRLFGARRAVTAEVPVAEMRPAPDTWPVLDRWGVWIGVTLAVVAVAYLPFFLTYKPHFVSPGLRVW